MPLQTFDDGSTLLTDDLGDPLGFTYASDYADQAKLGAFQPAKAGTPWWQGLLTYGATKAIDSHYGSNDLARYNPATGVGYVGAAGQTLPLGQGFAQLTQSGTGLLMLLAVGILGFALLTNKG